MGTMCVPKGQGANNTDVTVIWGVETDSIPHKGVRRGTGKTQTTVRRNVIQVTVRVPVRHTVQEHLALQVFLKAVKRLKGLANET